MSKVCWACLMREVPLSGSKESSAGIEPFLDCGWWDIKIIPDGLPLLFIARKIVYLLIFFFASATSSLIHSSLIFWPSSRSFRTCWINWSILGSLGSTWVVVELGLTARLWLDWKSPGPGMPSWPFSEILGRLRDFNQVRVREMREVAGVERWVVISRPSWSTAYWADCRRDLASAWSSSET